MAKFIVLIMQNEHDLTPENTIFDVADIALSDKDDNHLITFDSIEEADAYRDKYTIDGQVVEIPTY